MEVLLKNQDTTLFTLVQPNPGKETILLLHGGPGLPDGLSFLREVLAKDFQVIMFHQRGTQKSPAPSHDYSLESYLSDINHVADHFALEQFHLFGHSWGGLYAQVYAQQHPHRLKSLFLCSPASGTGRQWLETMLEINRYNLRKSSLREWLWMGVNAGLGALGSDAGYRRLYRQILRNFNRGFQKAYPEYFALSCVKASAINGTLKAILAYPLLPSLKQPGFKITITYGDQDIFGRSQQYVLQRYPTALRYILPASGHIPWLHNQDDFLRVLEQHYKR